MTVSPADRLLNEHRLKLPANWLTGEGRPRRALPLLHVPAGRSNWSRVSVVPLDVCDVERVAMLADNAPRN